MPEPRLDRPPRPADRRQLRRRPRGRAGLRGRRRAARARRPPRRRAGAVAAEHALDAVTSSPSTSPTATRPRPPCARPSRCSAASTSSSRTPPPPSSATCSRCTRTTSTAPSTVTFTGAVDVIRAALPHLRESRGIVVATGSLMSRVPLPTWSSYSASKHALRGFLNSLRDRGARAAHRRARGDGPPRPDRHAAVRAGVQRAPAASRASRRTPTGAELVAQALVEVVVRPRPEVVLGGETPADRRRVRDRAAGRRGGAARHRPLVPQRQEAAARPGSLWEAPRATAGQRRHPRARQPARAAPARAAAAADRRRRRCASRATSRSPAGAPRGIAGELTRPVPEREPPRESLGAADGQRAGRERVSL